MSNYKVIEESINIHAGVLVLDRSQADARMNRLTPLGGNRYDVTRPPVMFKRGEIFELEGELPKALVQAVEGAEGFSKVQSWPKKEQAKSEPEPVLKKPKK